MENLKTRVRTVVETYDKRLLSSTDQAKHVQLLKELLAYAEEQEDRVFAASMVVLRHIVQNNPGLKGSCLSISGAQAVAEKEIEEAYKSLKSARET